MGSPLLADLLMHNLEFKKITTDNQFSQYKKFLGIYVDDILIVWHSGLDMLDDIFDHVNNIHNSIKFTLETRNCHKSLNFLDLTISIYCNNFEYQVFKKPTNTGTVINNDSNSPIQHKLAAFHSYLNRLVSLPLIKG